MLSAASLRWTICGFLFFMRSAGTAQIRLCRSISSHLAPRASRLTAAGDREYDEPQAYCRNPASIGKPSRKFRHLDIGQTRKMSALEALPRRKEVGDIPLETSRVRLVFGDQTVHAGGVEHVLNSTPGARCRFGMCRPDRAQK